MLNTLRTWSDEQFLTKAWEIETDHGRRYNDQGDQLAAALYAEDRRATHAAVILSARKTVRRHYDTNRYRPWAKVHEDYKMTSEDGRRYVLVLEECGTALVPWIGPDGE